jgi:hypothetical protein
MPCIDKGSWSLSPATPRYLRIVDRFILRENEREQARAQKRKACRSQGEKAARDDILMSHTPPPASDARPNSLRFSEKPACKKVMLLVDRNKPVKSSLSQTINNQARERTPSNA